MHGFVESSFGEEFYQPGMREKVALDKERGERQTESERGLLLQFALTRCTECKCFFVTFLTWAPNSFFFRCIFLNYYVQRGK